MSLPLLLATQNAGKLIEVKAILEDLPFQFHDLTEFSNIETVEETGETFEENAGRKAAGYACQFRMLTLADDSGLEVDALDGRPGVRSARYAEEHAEDHERVKKLLGELTGKKELERRARFVSVIAIAGSTGKILNLSRGTCEGMIAFQPRGTAGFGYDPVFVPDGHNQTFGELAAQVKNEISHRARALQQARAFLLGLTPSSRAG